MRKPMRDPIRTPDHRQTLHHWDTPEFIPLPRGKRWYTIAGLIFSGLLIIAIFSGNWTMAIAITLLAVVFFAFEKRQPKHVTVEISSMGLWYKDKFYPYHHLNSFWIVYHPPYVNSLYLKIRKKRGFKLLKIELYHEDPNLIRELLIKEIPEIEGATEPMTDILSRLLRLQ